MKVKESIWRLRHLSLCCILWQSNFWKYIDRLCTNGKITFINVFFSFFVYTALNTVSTLTFPFICWFYVHRITYFFLFMTINSFSKVFYVDFRWFGYAESYLFQYSLLFLKLQSLHFDISFQILPKEQLKKKNNDSSKVFCIKIPILLNLSLIINLLFNWMQAYEWMKVIS